MSTPTSKRPGLCVCVCVHACGIQTLVVYLEIYVQKMLNSFCQDSQLYQEFSAQPTDSSQLGESSVGCRMAQCLMCCVVIFSLTMMCTHATPLRTCTHIFLIDRSIQITMLQLRSEHVHTFFFFIDRSIQCYNSAQNMYTHFFFIDIHCIQCCTGKSCFIC